MAESKKQRAEREAAEAAAAAQESQETTEENTDPLAGLSDDGAQSFVEDLLNQAESLQEEKAALFGRIDANRTTLRTIKTTGMLSEKQAAAIDLWYPPRTKKETTEAAAAA